MLQDVSSTEKAEKEAGWIETSMTRVLNSQTTSVKVKIPFIMWWTLDVAVKSKEYGGGRPLYQQERARRFSLKAIRNSYYYIV